MANNGKIPKGYNRDFLTCRTFGHAWSVGSSASEAPSFWGFVLVCRTCGTRRIDSINRRTGAVAARSYEYPEGYQLGHSTSRVAFRLEFVKRS